MSICPISATKTPPAPRRRCSTPTRRTEADAEALGRRPGSGVRCAGHGLGRAGQERRWKSASCSKLGQGTIVELDRKVGEAIDIYVNDRLVARGEVVLVEDRLGVTMTEIIKAGSGS